MMYKTGHKKAQKAQINPAYRCIDYEAIVDLGVHLCLLCFFVANGMNMETNNNLLDWIALSFVTGIGSRTAAMLIDQLGSPAECFNARSSALEALRIKGEIIDQLKSGEPRLRAETELKNIESLSGEVLTLADRRYPQLLRETYDPPIVLYSSGNAVRALEQPVLAIVGSRHCSTYGRNVAEMLARELAMRGVTIASGLARGIDSAAHQGALDGKGLSIAVMGTGLDEVYPKENKRLAERLRENGVLLTEFPLATPPLPQNFPFRNRIISGLALGVMIVEGAERSGSLITARMAYEQNREVFAVPGNITSAKSFGPNYLIKDGAKLVQTWRDVVEEFPFELKSPILSAERIETTSEQLRIEEVALSASEKQVLSQITFDVPIHIDQLKGLTRLSFGELNDALFNLEMQDRIRQLPGKYFARKL
jgi:DNA processing protein